MSTIKMQQAYLSDLQNTVCKAADHSSSAANTVSKAINGLSNMQFSSKESTIAELSSLKQRLNLLYQNGCAYGKLIGEYSDSIQAIDENTNDISDTIIGRISAWTEGAATSLFSFSLSTQLGKQAATAGLFLGSAGLLSGITKIGKGIWDTVKAWFGKIIPYNSSPATPPENNWNLPNNIPYYSAYFNPANKNAGAINWDEWPEGYNGMGCMAASYATSMSGFLGRKVTPKEIYEVNGNTLGWQSPGVYEKAFGISYVKGITADRAGLDKALDNYLSDPNKYSAPIIYCGNIPHGVVITGRNDDGSYIMIDSGAKANEVNLGRSTYRMTTDAGSLNADGTMTGKLTHIWQYTKETETHK